MIAAGVFVLIGLVALLLISKKSPKGTILVLAIGIWMAGSSSGETKIRELLLLAGALKLLGSAGVILGIVDLVRKRKTNVSNEPPVSGVPKQ